MRVQIHSAAAILLNSRPGHNSVRTIIADIEMLRLLYQQTYAPVQAAKDRKITGKG